MLDGITMFVSTSFTNDLISKLKCIALSWIAVLFILNKLSDLKDIKGNTIPDAPAKDLWVAYFIELFMFIFM